MQRWKGYVTVIMAVTGFQGESGDDIDGDLRNFEDQLMRATGGSCSPKSPPLIVTSVRGIGVKPLSGHSEQITAGPQIYIPSIALGFPQVGRLLVLDPDTYCHSNPFRFTRKRNPFLGASQHDDDDVQCMPQYSTADALHGSDFSHAWDQVKKSLSHLLPEKAIRKSIVGKPPDSEASTALCFYRNTHAASCFAEALAKFESAILTNWPMDVHLDVNADVDEQLGLNMFLHEHDQIPEKYASLLEDHKVNITSIHMALAKECGAKFGLSTSIADDWDSTDRHDRQHCWRYGFGSEDHAAGTVGFPPKLDSDDEAVLFGSEINPFCHK